MVRCRQKEVLSMYDEMIANLEDKRDFCNYAYGGTVPLYYQEALRRAIEALRECQECERGLEP
jgi:hypothetical protein